MCIRDRFGRSAGFEALVAAGKPGVYQWVDGKPVVDPEVAALWPQGPTPLTSDQVLDRARDALAEEIRLMLDEAVVAGPEDIDLCMILGAGWPFHLGGITPYLDRTGIAAKVTGAPFGR